MENPNELLEQMVRKRVHRISRFYTHLFIYTLGVIFYVAKTYYGVPFNFWPVMFINGFVMCFWTFFLVIQGVRLFFTERVFGTNWEKKRIREIIEQERTGKQKWQ